MTLKRYVIKSLKTGYTYLCVTSFAVEWCTVEEAPAMFLSIEEAEAKAQYVGLEDGKYAIEEYVPASSKPIQEP